MILRVLAMGLALFAVLVFATAAIADYGSCAISYFASDGYYADSEHYVCHYSEEMTITYSITGNTVDISKVEIKVVNQESTWTDLGSNSSGNYGFTPSYWTSFLPYLLVTYEDSVMRIFNASALIQAGADDEEARVYTGPGIDPAILPGMAPYSGTRTCYWNKCYEGECLPWRTTIPSNQSCAPFQDECLNDDDC